MSFVKEAFTVSGLFNEDAFGSSIACEKGKRGLICDDTEFSLRLRRETGKRIIYNPDVKIWHKVYSFRLTPKFIRRYAYQHAYSKAVIKRLREALSQKPPEFTFINPYDSQLSQKNIESLS